MDKEIKAYQDGAYDALKGLPQRVENAGCKTMDDVLHLVALTLAAMDKISTRKLGTDEAQLA